MKTAIVIGAGIGGLASAIRLQRKGYKTTVLEANAYPGGKLTSLNLGKYRFDAGPSLFTLPNLIEDLFPNKAEFDKHFPFVKLDRSCHYFWNDGTEFKAWFKKDQLEKEISQVLDVPSAPFIKKLEKSKFQYETLSELFLEQSLHLFKTYLSKATFKAITRIPKLELFSSMNDSNKKLNHPKLAQLFNRYATYNGSNPYQAPGVLNMIPHLEYNVGTFFPKNGMVQIRESLVKLAEESGVEILLNTPVSEIKHNELGTTGVVSSQGLHKTNLVVCNADIHQAYSKLLPRVKPPNTQKDQEASSSALIFYWGIKKTFAQLHLHNLFFADNYEQEFKCIFETGEQHPDPSIYINITSKLNPKDAPKNKENWFVMINVPSSISGLTQKDIAQAKSNIIRKLNRQLKCNLEDLIEEEDHLSPQLIQSKTGSHMGALYGSSSNNQNSAFLRHPNFHSKIKGLYFAGGSVHPGGGIPLCLLSAKIIEDLVD